MAPVVLMTSSSAALGSTYSNTQSTASSTPVSCGPGSGSEVSAAWGVGCKTVRATTMAATTRPATIQKPGGIPTCSPLVGPNTGLGHNSMIVMIEA